MNRSESALGAPPHGYAYLVWSLAVEQSARRGGVGGVTYLRMLACEPVAASQASAAPAMFNLSDA